MIKITFDLSQNTPTESVGRTSQTDYFFFSLLVLSTNTNEMNLMQNIHHSLFRGTKKTRRKEENKLN